MDIQKAADALCAAEKGVYQIPMLSTGNPEMTVADAYAVQLRNIDLRKAAGEKVVGMKIGLTSTGMQKLLNVDVPDSGHLMSSMLLLEGMPCDTKKLCQPKAEGEIAFCLKKALRGPGLTIADVYAATDYVVPAIEIVDSRIRDWKIKLVDTIADNGSAARFVVGSRMTPIANVDMRLTGMTLEKNGVLVNSGAAAEVWGNPAAAVAWLANALSAYDIELPAGGIILAGALTAAVPAAAGDNITASFCGMGSVGVKFI